MTGVVHLQHTILFAGGSQNVIVVHHHDRRIDGIPPVLMMSEEGGTALELGHAENGRSELHVLEGANERSLICLVFLLDVEESTLHEVEGERSRFHVEEARAESGVFLEDGGVE